MRHVVEVERQTPVYDEVDVLVCGGGVAGVAAALCAARNGASVLLLERYGYLGGLATGGLVITVPPLDNGVASELRLRLERARSYLHCENLGDDPSVDGMIAVDPEILKFELVTMLLDAGVKLLLHTYVVESIMDDASIRGVTFENKAGRAAVLAKTIVDATGDGDVSARAGAAFEMAPEPLPVTLMANMIDVDSQKAVAQLGHWGNLRSLVKDGIDSGELPFELEIYSKGFAPGVFAADLCYPGEINLWPGSMFGVSGLDPDQLTRAEIVTREHVMRLAGFLKQRLSGFERSRIEYTANQIGVRETRRIVGGVTPSLQEIFTTKFPDTVAKPYVGKDMRIPYGCLVPTGIDNLLVAGRCMSASQDAMVQLRLIPVCLATGQAAGTAAALATRNEVTPRGLDVTLLRETLAQQGVALD